MIKESKRVIRSKSLFMIFIISLVILANKNQSVVEGEESSGKWWENTVIVGAQAYNWVTPAKLTEAIDSLHLEVLDRGPALCDRDYRRQFDKEKIDVAIKKGIRTLAAFQILYYDEPDAKEKFRINIYDKLPDDKKWKDLKGNVIVDPKVSACAKDINGNVLDIHGNIYAMSANQRYWADFFIEAAKFYIDMGLDGIDFDNYSIYFTKGGDYSDWAIDAFKNHLKVNLKSSLGIKDIDSFNMTDYIKQNYIPLLSQKKSEIERREIIFSDPIMREWVKFQYVSTIDLYKYIAKGIKDYAKTEYQKEIPVFGNSTYVDYRDSHLSVPTPPLVGDTEDIIQMETKTTPDSPWRYTFFYRLGLSAGRYSKPVWSFGSFYATGETRPYYNLNKLAIAEAYSNGAIREFDLAGWPGYGMEHAYATIVLRDGKIPEDYIRYANFIYNNQDYFKDTGQPSKVAIVYSIPSFIWSQFPLLKVTPLLKVRRMIGYARVLEEAHIPYDILIFGSSLYNDTDMLKRIPGYDLIIFPDVDCISDSQINALSTFIKKGGSIIYSGELGVRDDNFNKRKPPLESMLQKEGKVIKIAENPDLKFFFNTIGRNMSDPENFSKLIIPVKELLNNKLQIKTDAPSNVYINLLRKDTRLLVHIVNYDHNIQTDEIIPKKDITISVRLPDDFKIKNEKLLLISPDSGEKINLIYRVVDNYLEFKIPDLYIYNIVVIE